MAVDMFLKIKGVDGESVDKVHAKEIDILSWSWGMSQSGTTHTARGGGAGKVSVQDLSITKYTDKSTPNLIKACCNGKHFEEAVLTVRKAGEQPLEYVILTMKDVLVTNVSEGGSGGDDRLTENITLNFAEFSYVYVPQKRDGGADGKVEATFNIATNSEK
ncbi:type VI secretion system tube protein Hcp [Limnobacter humi]|uniref:Type VI secretion system tube protein Hcp n=1 Tax=Limnobacter humi TaxID=1778671 RepID=A0ABT1WE37_9BURK|nr:type VI secretion system tube protein Hcp [Limnobacter humi]MCQ8895760.1 type VI secretion system tube protein Hcp [Limnobacter humi]